LAVTIVFTFIRYREENLRWDMITRDRLHIAATSIKFILPTGYLDKAVSANSISPEEYKDIYTRLSYAAWENKFEYLYVIKRVNDKYYFIASSITKTELAKGGVEPYWIEYSEAPRELERAFRTGKTVYSRVTDRWGTFYSALVPEYTPKGELYVAGADYNYNIVEHYLYGVLFNTMVQAFILLLLLLLIYLSISRLQRHYIRKLQFSNAVNESSPVGVISIQITGLIDYANQVFADLAGVSLTRLEGSNINDDLGFHKHDELINRIRICLSRQISWQGEFINHAMDGKEYWVNAQINFVVPSHGSRPMLNVFANDVTPQMKSRISLAQHNRILKFLSQNIHVLLANPDLDSAFSQVMQQYGQNLNKNRVAILQKLGSNYEITASWSNTEPVSQPISVNMFSQVQKIIFSDWEANLERGQVLSGESYDFPISLLTLARISTPGIIHLCPIVSKGKYWGFVLTLQSQRDEMLDAELETSVLNSISDSIGNALNRFHVEDALRKSTEAKTSFLSSMSHEIRTPLNGVVGMINLLESTNLTPEQMEYIEAIRVSGRQLLNLINNILDISRIEAGKAVFRSDPIKLRACLQAATNIVSFELKEKNLALNIDFDPKLPRLIQGDETRLRQIILNLLHNAIKFTDRGTISIEVIRAGERRIQFRIADTGIGMNKEALANVFEPFYQTGQTSQKLKGTGLGLAITKHLIELMHGHITVESELGKGTIFAFTIELPVLEEAPEYQDHTANIDQNKSLSESDPEIISSITFLPGQDLDDKVVVNFLQSLGYKPRIVANWDDLTQLMSVSTARLVIINTAQQHNQPVQVLETVNRLLQVFPQVHWLLLISPQNHQQLSRGAVWENVTYMDKPIAFEKLVEFIRKSLDQTISEVSHNPRKANLETH
jgi:PAS domain S-box-containing protein